MKHCKSFHKEGVCLYGIRCCFIHDEKNFIKKKPNRTKVKGWNNKVESPVCKPSSKAAAHKMERVLVGAALVVALARLGLCAGKALCKNSTRK